MADTLTGSALIAAVRVRLAQDRARWTPRQEELMLSGLMPRPDIVRKKAMLNCIEALCDLLGECAAPTALYTAVEDALRAWLET